MRSAAGISQDSSRRPCSQFRSDARCALGVDHERGVGGVDDAGRRCDIDVIPLDDIRLRRGAYVYDPDHQPAC